jgi:hypothetical protein
VAVRRRERGVLYTELLHRVWISRETRPGKIVKLQNEYGNGNLGTAACGEVVKIGQTWCVDGPDPRQDGPRPDDEAQSEVS